MSANSSGWRRCLRRCRSPVSNDSQITDGPPAEHPWIAYVGPFSYPDGGAAARRIFGMSLSLIAAGYNVLIVSGQESPEEPGHARQLAPGLWLASTHERDAEHLPRLFRLPRYSGMGRRTRDCLAAQASGPAAV